MDSHPVYFSSSYLNLSKYHIIGFYTVLEPTSFKFINLNNAYKNDYKTIVFNPSVLKITITIQIIQIYVRIV